MEQWIVSYSEKQCKPVLVAFVNSSNPTLFFKIGEKRFQVVFENKSDYMAAKYHTPVIVKVINADRTKYWDGAAELVQC